MYQKFFTKTIESKFIKNLLKNTPLPIYKIIRDNPNDFKWVPFINTEVDEGNF